MELLGQLGRSALLVVAGLLVVAISFSEQFELGPIKYSSTAPVAARVTLLIVGVVLVLAGLIAEYVSYRRSLVAEDGEDERHDLTALQTLDELPSFIDYTAGATRISILARTGVNLMNSYERLLQEKCSAGIEIRLVFVNPRPEAARHLYGGKEDVYRQNLETARLQLQRLRQVAGPRLSIRVTDDVPPFSLVYVEGELDRVRIQMNLMHSRIGRDRPVLSVEAESQWFDAFRDEFVATWDNAVEFR